MARNVTKIRIFLASPGDTLEERKLAADVIIELNKINISDNIELELIKWETHAYSGIGEDAQDVINKQIDDDYDIFLGIMWKRFGTPTKRALSGTDEEFMRALEIYKSKVKPIKILFFFSQVPIPPKDIEIEQLQKINDFRNSLKEIGVLPWEYSDSREFESLLRVHISKSVKELIGELNIERVIQVKSNESIEPEINNANEEGLFDLMALATEEFIEIESVLGSMTQLMTDLAAKLSKRADEMNAVDMRMLKPQDVTRLIDKASNDMQHYVRRMNIEMPVFKESMSNGFDSLSKAYSIYFTDWSEVAKDEIESFDKLEELLVGMNDFLNQMHSLRSTIINLPRATSNFNKAKKDTEKIIKSLITEVDSSVYQINEIKKLRGSIK